MNPEGCLEPLKLDNGLPQVPTTVVGLLLYFTCIDWAWMQSMRCRFGPAHQQPCPTLTVMLMGSGTNKEQCLPAHSRRQYLQNLQSWSEWRVEKGMGGEEAVTANKTSQA